ncbi:MAG: LysR family transcriptional regulator [Rhodobacteraceae bacterium]|nr:LysR family transcriptional regulator [Paracoccaceae bacterium]
MLYLTLRHYEYAVEVARQGSLTAAAGILNVSQPALSTALTRIEDHLGQKLFLRRRGASLVLTPQGREFAARAQKLLDQAAALETPNMTSPGLQRLSLGCFADLAPFLLAPALKILRRALPNVQIDFHADHFEPLISALTKSEIDLALSYDLGLDSSFYRHELGRVAPHALMAPDHPLASQTSLSLATLAAHPLILSQEGLSVQHMLALFKSKGLVPRVARRAASLELLRSLAANGEGIGISYSLPPGRLSYDGRPLITVPVSDPQAEEPIVLISHVQAAAGTVIGAAQTALASHLMAEGENGGGSAP